MPDIFAEQVFPDTGDFPTLPNAPTTESIFEAMKNGTWRGTGQVEGALKVLFEAKHIEQFNFGPIKLDTLRELQKEAIEFIEYGCLSLPYPECVFRCSVEFANRTVGFHIFAVERFEDRHEVAVLGTIHSKDFTLTLRCNHLMKVSVRPEGKAVELNIPSAELRYWEPRIGGITRGPYLEGNGEIISEAALILMGLIMILNTKGVLKERTAPPAKPNKVRAARGTPLIAYTTRVYTAVYNEAVKAGPQGTHASPRPHRRRAHIRHYPKTDKHDAYIKHVDAMLVNWNGEPLEARAEYKVK